MSDLKSDYWKELVDALNEAGSALGQRTSGNPDAIVAAMGAAGEALRRASRAVNNLQADLTADD